MEDDESVLKYMTLSETEEQHSSLLMMTQPLFMTISPMCHLYINNESFCYAQPKTKSPELPFGNPGELYLYPNLSTAFAKSIIDRKRLITYHSSHLIIPETLV